MGKKINNCLFCGEDLWQVVRSVFDTRFGVEGFYDICKCSKCSLVQSSLLPSEADLKDLYEEYYNFGGSKDGLYTRFRDSFLMSPLYRLWLVLDGDISFHSGTGKGRLLDVGCNEGRGLKLYKKNGFDAEGLEFNELAAKAAREAGFNVYTGLIEEFTPTEPYDVVVLSNVIEHSLDPKEMLKSISTILKPGGEVWISCPNIKSWQVSLFGSRWINWHPPFHISYYSKQTLNDVLVSAGFSVNSEKVITPALWVVQSLISFLFAREGAATKQLRATLLVAGLMFPVRFLLFPLLWFGNVIGKGDCLVVTAKKGSS